MAQTGVVKEGLEQEAPNDCAPSLKEPCMVVNQLNPATTSFVIFIFLGCRLGGFQLVMRMRLKTGHPMQASSHLCVAFPAS